MLLRLVPFFLRGPFVGMLAAQSMTVLATFYIGLPKIFLSLDIFSDWGRILFEKWCRIMKFWWMTFVSCLITDCMGTQLICYD